MAQITPMARIAFTGAALLVADFPFKAMVGGSLFFKRKSDGMQGCPLKGTWRHVGLSFKKDMHGWPGPLFGAIIFSVFPKNHYKKLVFGGPNHSQRDPLSQAVILVRWGCSPS